jgi:RecB family exonuclease
MHAGENEALSRQITSLKREINRLAGDRSLPGIRRLELRNQTLEDENARLRAELRTATASWRRLEVEARSTTELYAFSKAMIRRVAALEAERGERRHDPAVAAIQQ